MASVCGSPAGTATLHGGVDEADQPGRNAVDAFQPAHISEPIDAVAVVHLVTIEIVHEWLPPVESCIILSVYSMNQDDRNLAVIDVARIVHRYELKHVCSGGSAGPAFKQPSRARRTLLLDT